MEVILRLFPCPYLSRPFPTNSQTEKQTCQWPGLFSRREQIPPSPTPRLFPTRFLQTGPLLLLISSKRDNPAVYSESCFPQLLFLPVFQKCLGRALNRTGWGTCWPGESRHFLAEPSILAIWVRDPKWTVVSCCRVIVASVGGPPRKTPFQSL